MNTTNNNKLDLSLVFVHGYMGGSDQWQDQVRICGKEFNVITIDLPGFGLNNQMHSPDTISGYAQYVLDNLTERGIDRFHLLGHSMGGMIVQQMVALQPSRIEKLILYGTGPVGQMPGRFETLEKSRQRLLADGIDATAKRISATWFLDYEQGNGYDSCAKIATLSSVQAATAALTAMESWSGEAALCNITSPTLVLWGDHDRAYLWQQPHQLWQEIADSQLAVIPGCSHAVHLEKPNIFNAVLLDFLQS